ncbi:hypothetical protein BV20DRAFT_735039 [Pilatotrama ljubarskyi]|nr:hypothetical protein BV20DRAFT_735039 [Pilatotrama ljubarskyi]
MSNNLLEVTKEIKIDHDNVRDLFDRFKAATDLKEKAILANTLVREMAIHGDAECVRVPAHSDEFGTDGPIHREVSVYNDYSALGLGDTAAHNKEEHAEIKRLVEAADKTSVEKPEYTDVIERAVTTFLTHAKEEEDDQHPLIRAKLSPEDNDKLARAFLKARKMVPRRPHPAAPQTGGLAQKAAGLQAHVHDKVVETVTGRDFAPLRFSHPDI